MSGPGLSDRIAAFSRLGEVMMDACSSDPVSPQGSKLRELALNLYKSNPWFIPQFVINSIEALALNLKEDILEKWLAPYSVDQQNRHILKFGVVMAGNIPLVGFHDFLSVLITGNIFLGKTSSKDTELINALASILIETDPRFKDYIILKEDTIDGFDAVIATGSNNSSRYFEYYFGSKPHIFRKNRNSAAIIDSETEDYDLEKLGKDIFYYFGLGCRSVSKLYLPADFKINRLKNNWTAYSDLLSYIPYHNNYKYNKALYSLENKAYYDHGLVLLKEDAGFSSPVSVLNYSLYKNEKEIKTDLEIRKDQIQTIVGKGYTPFGMSQFPALNDYADGIDTIKFIQNLS